LDKSLDKGSLAAKERTFECKVYYEDANGDVVCLDAVTGELKWGLDLVREFGATVPPWYTGQCPLIDNGRQPTGEQLAILMRARRSARTFAERPVPRDIVRDLASVSRWGPSAQNSQDVDWIAIDDRARITEMSKATLDEIRRFSHLMRHPVLRGVLRLFLGRELTKSAGRNPRVGEELLDRWAKGLDPVFYNAPVVLVGHTRSRRAFARDDAIYAAYNLMLAAERQGLSTCQIGIFQMTAEHSNKVRRMLGLSEGRTAQVTLVLGYPLHPFRRLVPRRMPELVWNPR